MVEVVSSANTVHKRWDWVYPIGIVLLTCFACTAAELTPIEQTEVANLAQQLWNQPEPLPPQIKHIALEGSRQQCVRVDQLKVWELGDQTDGLKRKVSDTSRIHIDGMEVKNLEFGTLLIDMTMFDENNQVIGSSGGPLSICFKMDIYPVGKHLAEVEFRSTSDKVYRYRWAFDVTRQGTTTIVRLPLSICSSCEYVIEDK